MSRYSVPKVRGFNTSMNKNKVINEFLVKNSPRNSPRTSIPQVANRYFSKKKSPAQEESIIFNKPIDDVANRVKKIQRNSKTTMPQKQILPNMQLDYSNNAFTPNENINRSQFHKYSRKIK